MTLSDTISEAEGRGVGRNAVWLLVAQVVTLAAGLATVVAISRTLGPADLGRFRVAQAVLAYLVVLADAGLSQLIVRDVARRAEVAPIAFPAAIVRSILAVIAIAVTWAVLAVSGIDRDQAVLIGAFALSLLPAAVALFPILLGHEEMGIASLVRGAAAAGSTVVGIAILIATGSLLGVVLAAVGGSAIGSATSILIVKGRYGLDPRLPGRREIAAMLRRGFPFLVAGVAIQVIFNADALIIQVVRGEADLGRYAASYAIAGYSLVLGGAIVGAAFPRFAAAAGLRGDVHRLLGDVLALMGAIAWPLALGGAAIAGPLVATLFGDAFAGEGGVLTVLLTLPLIGYFNMTAGQFLSASDDQRQVMIVAVVSALANVALNLLLVPSLGIIGAAAAVALTEGLTLAAYARQLRWRGIGDSWRAYFLMAPSSLLAAAIVLVARFGFGWSAIPLLLTGCVVYAAIVVASPFENQRRVRRTIRALVAA